MVELHDFCHNLRDKVREFEKWYREAAREDSESFPVEYPEEVDWWEQFSMYVEA